MNYRPRDKGKRNYRDHYEYLWILFHFSFRGCLENLIGTSLNLIQTANICALEQVSQRSPLLMDSTHLGKAELGRCWWVIGSLAWKVSASELCCPSFDALMPASLSCCWQSDWAQAVFDELEYTWTHFAADCTFGQLDNCLVNETCTSYKSPGFLFLFFYLMLLVNFSQI